MHLIKEVRSRIRHLEPEDILDGMGYVDPRAATIEHLSFLSNSPYLGLDRLFRDGVHTEKSFAMELCRFLGLKESTLLRLVEGLAVRLDEDRAAFRHWIFVDVDYVWGRGTPLFAMALCEHLRRLPLPIDMWRLSWEERLQTARNAVRDHMRDTGGTLDFWGKIKRYEFFHAEGECVTFSPDGEVIGIKTNYHPPRATLYLERNPDGVPRELAGLR